MAKGTWVKKDGVWYSGYRFWKNVGGTWIPDQIPWIKEGGVWYDCLELGTYNPPAGYIDWIYPVANIVWDHVDLDLAGNYYIPTILVQYDFDYFYEYTDGIDIEAFIYDGNGSFVNSETIATNDYNRTFSGTLSNPITYNYNVGFVVSY